MRSVAAMVRYHRGALPANSSFAGLDRKARGDLLRMIGVLRLANALDEAHRGNVSEVAVARQDGGVAVFVRGLQAMSRDAECVARARYLLEAVCRLPIAVRALRAKTAGSSSAARVRSRAAPVP